MTVKRFKMAFQITEVDRNKALIRYEIKFLENRLHKAMGNGKTSHLRAKEAAQFSSALTLKYSELVSLLEPKDCTEKELSLSPLENNASRSYVIIQTLKQQLNPSLPLGDEIRILRQLIHHYKYLQNQLNEMQPQSLGFIQAALKGKLKALLTACTPSEWLHAVVDLANDTGENMLSCLSLIEQLSQEEILELETLFEKPDISLLVNSIFFYKLNPDQLFKQSLHPEKLVSVKSRLIMLYHFIERLHQTIFHYLKQRGIGKMHDYLFHEDELPDGIIINAENNASLIVTALKEWHLSKFGLSDDFMIRNKLTDLFRAYKFWFNPNRLIDTAMTLQQVLAGNVRDDENYTKFFIFMQGLFHQISTMECLDLYGYFANKDSRYLMRTLAALLKDQEVTGVARPTSKQKESLNRVYQTLNTIMEALREELRQRNIMTEPYPSDNAHKILKPGHRNLNAIIRVMNLYCDSIVTENKTIDALFQEMGSNF